MGIGAIKAGQAFVEIFSDDKPLVRGLRGIEARVKKTGASIGAVGTKVANLGTGVASVGAVGLGALLWPLKLAANMEKTEAAFSTLLKDQAKAKELLGEIRQFSASTPFQFPELADASKKLLAFGSSASNIANELRMIGDIASGVGQPIGEIAEIYGKARVQGRLFAEDINQLVGRGIPVIQALAAQFGVTKSEVKKLVSEGSVNFGHLQKAFESMTSASGQFAGGMKAASKTLIGMFSTLKDNIELALAPLGEALLPTVKQLVAAGTGIAKVFGDWVSRNKQLVAPLAAALTGMTAFGGATAIAGVALIGVASAISVVGSVAGVVGSVVATLGAPAIGIFAASTVGAMALYGAIGHITHQAGLLMPALKFLKRGFSDIWGVAGETFSNITTALKAGEWRLAAKVAWSGIKLATLTGARHVLEGVDALWNNLGDITWRFLKSLMQAFGQVFSSLPKIAWAAVRGQLALDKFILETLGTVLTGDNLNLAAKLDPMLNKARIEFGQSKQQVAALNNQNNRPAQQRRVGQVQANNRIGRVGQQQRRMPQNMPPAARAYQQRLQQARQYEARRAQQQRIAMQQQAMRRRPPNALANRPIRPQQQINPAQMQQMLQHMQRQTQLQQQLVNEGGLG
ncbi:MAG: tape measure protein [Planctomycetota bacterium]